MWIDHILPTRKTARFWVCLLIVLFIAFGSLCAEVEICLKPSGLEAAGMMRQQNESAVNFANKFTSDHKTWVYIRQLSFQEREAVWKKTLGETASTALIEDGASTPIWFIQSNNQTAGLGEHKLHDGLALEMKTEDEAALFSSPVMAQLSSLMPQLVVIESERNFDATPFDPHKTLVLKANPRADSNATNRADVLASLATATPASVSIINLMPQQSSEAEPWKFSAFQADLYSTAGHQLVSDFQKFGYRDKVSTPHSKLEFQSSIEQAAKGNKLVLLIGESSDDGLSLRIPNSEELIKSDDLNKLPSNVNILGLFCNSSHALKANNTAAVVGTLYSNVTRKVLQATLDLRPAPTVAEFTGVLDNSLSVGTDFSKLVGVVSTFLDNIGAKPGSAGAPLLLVNGSASGLSAGFPSLPPPPPPPPPQPDDDGGNRVGLYFVTGVIGGFAREFFRWRKLRGSKRHDLFFKPIFLSISVVELVLGGVCAVIFQNLSPFPSWRLPVSFVVGAGLEVVVRIAAKGKIWNPAVKQGNTGPQKPSLLEYMRA